MLKIIRPRQAGKSSELIRIAEKKNVYIIVATRERALHLAKMAEEQGRHILFPITYSEYKSYGLAGRRELHILIDDADAVLQQVFCPLQIDAITMTENEENTITNQSIIKSHIEDMLENFTIDEIAEVLKQMRRSEGRR